MRLEDADWAENVCMIGDYVVYSPNQHLSDAIKRIALPPHASAEASA